MKTQVREELTGRIIPFWHEMKDNENGGFYGEKSFDLKTNTTATKACLINSRILCFFSSAYLEIGCKQSLDDAHHAYDFMVKNCIDEVNGGIYWSLSYDGSVFDDTKHTYNQAFAIYALSVYYSATKNENALKLAIVDILSGRYNPSGKLPVSIPKHLGQTPMYYSKRLSGKKQFWHNRYLEMDVKPLYPFGFGLSYTDFKFKKDKIEFTENGISVDFSIENVGDCDGAEVAQIYVGKKYCSVAQPLIELKSYKKVHIKSGETVALNTFIDYDSLGYHDIDMEFVLEDCEITISVATSCEDIKFAETQEVKFPGGKRKITDKVFRNTTKIC